MIDLLCCRRLSKKYAVEGNRELANCAANGIGPLEMPAFWFSGVTPAATRATQVPWHHFAVNGVTVTGPSRPESVNGQPEASNGR